MRKNLLLIGSLLPIAIGIIVIRYAEELSNKSRYAAQVAEILSAKCEKAELYFDKLKQSGGSEIPYMVSRADKDDIILLVYTNDSLGFWSSNSISAFESYPAKLFKSPVVSISNSFYYVLEHQVDSVKYVGLINIVKTYPYENDFLHSGYNSDFRLPVNASLSLVPGEGYDVNNTDGKFLFSIIIPDQTESIGPRIIIGYLLLVLGLLMIFSYLFLMIRRLNNPGKRIWVSLLVIVSVIGIRILQVLHGFSLRGIELFDPYLFADSDLVPSLGDLLINSILLFYIVLTVFTFFEFDSLKRNHRLQSNILIRLLFIIVYLAVVIYAHYFSRSLIINSNISFQPNELDQLTIYSLLGILIDGINYFSAGLMLIWVLNSVSDEKQFLPLLRVFILGSGLLFAILFFIGYPLDPVSVLFIYVYSFTFFILHFKGITIFRYSVSVVLLLIFSFYILAFIVQQSAAKEEKVRSSLALSLANEHDPIAEYLLEDIHNRIIADTEIVDSLTKSEINLDNLYEYLKRNYFKGYWNKYQLQLALCGPIDSVLIEQPDYQWYHCYNFYGSIIRDVGLKLSKTNFYYLDEQSGRISFLGRFAFPLPDYPFEITLFLELDSKLSNEFLGYPELLLDKKLQNERLIDEYSHAKYFKSNLISRHGEYSYSLSSQSMGNSDKEFSTIKRNGYKHLLYRPEKESLIVISMPSVRFIDLLIGFSYIFLFFYLCILLVFSFRNMSRPDFRFLADLRSKIQFSIIAVLLVSMLLIAASTIWFNVHNYRNNQDKLLHEKIQSVLVELNRRLGIQTELDPEWNARRYDNLNQLLIRYSDAFFTDINLYYPSGDLLATSRYEIFEIGLQGNKMDPVALHKMQTEKQAQFIHRERIGTMDYLSAYVPFENTKGKLLAYLNLPYFTKQTELQSALSTLIVTIINIYVILIFITIVLTVFITNQITRPLNLLQQRFRQLKLGKRYEQINYTKKDEIGSLVDEYNKMVIELERSVELLARSERESAWREMAKQVAHEIKNPLTPMRLSVQQLQRMWKEKREDYDTYLGSVTNTLLEQIDNLSAIATEFSNFAKMPVTRIESVDLVGLVNKTVELFTGSDDYAIHVQTDEDQFIIKADREQLSRVLMNLIRNAIQSVPEGRKGRIEIALHRESDSVMILIADNGKGIPEEIQHRLFTPNFTTKSGGMGLGLAIVKNILEELGGEISYTTEPEKGTVFSIKFKIPS